MKKYNIIKPNKIYINSFRPLCYTEIGRNAILNYDFKPFIDASCRREPDLESTYPSITSICRQGLFAPRLRKNDIIVYFSVKRKYFQDKEKNNKLLAILQVDDVFENHQKAFEWYTLNNIKIPSNCMVANNPPYNFDQSAGNFEKTKEIKEYLLKSDSDKKRQGELLLNIWDKRYKTSTDKWKMLVKTKQIYVELINPISLYETDLEKIFGNKIPNTRCAPSIEFNQLTKIAQVAGIDLIIN